MPEEVLRSHDVDPEGSPSAQMLTFQAAQRAEKDLNEALLAAKGVIDAKNRRIVKLEETITALRTDLDLTERELARTQEFARAGQ